MTAEKRERKKEQFEKMASIILLLPDKEKWRLEGYGEAMADMREEYEARLEQEKGRLEALATEKTENIA